jgi:hypothetical protein
MIFGEIWDASRPVLASESGGWPLTKKDENILRNSEKNDIKEIMAQLKKMVYGNQGVTTNQT